MTATYEFTHWDSPIAQVAGVLVAGTDETDLIPIGTGFFCAPNLALTARHVVDEIFVRFEKCLPTKAVGQVSFGLQLAHWRDGALRKWDVVAYGYSASIDIAALVLEPAAPLPNGFSWILPRFETLPPALGERVAAFGYPRSSHRVTEEGAAKIGLDPRTATGSVIEIHPRQRDGYFLPFPCFRTDAQFDGGISGGPVFNAAGRICGLVSSNLPPENPDGEHVSYVSLIWPALGLRLRRSLDTPSEPTEPYFLKELAVDGQMQVLNANMVMVKEGDEKDDVRFGG